jgi:glycosyltransferase involved in cell wall biosynthesis
MRRNSGIEAPREGDDSGGMKAGLSWLVRCFRKVVIQFVFRDSPTLNGILSALLSAAGRKMRHSRAVMGVGTHGDGGKRALLVLDFGFLRIQAGSRRVVEAQIEALKHYGYEVHGLFVHQAATTAKRRLEKDAVVALGVAVAFEAGLDASIAQFWKFVRLMRPAGRIGCRPIADLVEASEAMTLSPDLETGPGQRGYDLVLVNYVWNVPLAAMAAGGAPLIVETHDVQCRQIAHWESRQATPDEVAYEASVLNRADAVIALNADEHAVFEEYMATGKAFLLYPPSFAGTLPVADISGDLIDAVGPEIIPDGVARPLESVDAVFIGSRNDHNRLGLEWFVEKVLPAVRREIPTFTTAVAGPVVEAVMERSVAPILRTDGILVLGLVATVEPLYARSPLVVIPILSGEGVSIKTIEAMAHGKAVVTTSAGLRGFPRNVNYESHDNADDFARRIVNLLTDSDALAAAEAKSAAITRSHFTQEAYFEGFGRVIEGAEDTRRWSDGRNPEGAK